MGLLLILPLAFGAGMLMAPHGRDGAVGSSSPVGATISQPATLAISRALGTDLKQFWVTHAGESYVASNARQHLQLNFNGAGATITAAGGGRALIALQAIGSGAVLHQVGLAQPLARGSRVEYRRAGATEWFANGPAGVEQGFTIARQPAGAVHGALTLALGLSGTLRASPGAAGGLALVGAKGGAVLRYGDLSVTDASGRSLPARMTVAHGRVLISVDARGARYPIRVDPLVQDAELTNSGEDGEYSFGCSVAIDGTTVVVGADEATVGSTEHQGAAFVFTEPEGGWAGSLSQVAELTFKSAGAYSDFGDSVAISGETIVVGARYAGVSYGAVYEFTKPAGGWTGTLEPNATLGSGAFGYDFGAAVAISGSTVVVGAPDAQTTGSGEHQGLAEVFTEPGGGWKGDVAAAASFTSSASERTFEEFGAAVAVSGHTILVGAPGVIIPGEPQQGSNTETGTAYVFTEPGGGWTGSDAPAAALTDGIVGDKLGISVALGGEDTAFTGVPCAPITCNTHEGGAGVVDFYAKPGGGWASTSTPTGQLTDSAGHEPSDLGESLAADGSTVVAGAPLGNFVDVFDEPAGGWASETQSGQFPVRGVDGLTPSDFGFAVGISGDTPVATTFVKATREHPTSGAAFVFGLPVVTTTTTTSSTSSTNSTTSSVSTTTTATTTTSASTSTSAGPGIASTPKAIEEVLLGCGTSQLVLNDVFIEGGHVEISGSAAKSLVGKQVKILFDEHKQVATATVQADGQYATTAPLPSGKAQNSLASRYLAEEGKLRSLNLKLTRRLRLEPPKASGTTVTLAGEITLPLTKPIAPVTVEEQLECGKAKNVKTFTPPASGRFHIMVTVPASAKAGIFRLKSKVAANRHATSHGFATYSLPLPVALG